MTRITRMLMKGFKSFGKRTEFEFGSDFNCILGPNGSGKSNVIDALCFVLGKGSAKGLRADKAANLIYNGGKKKEPSKHGEVSIFFDNSKGTFPTKEASVKLTRIIKKSGQSVYKINDEKRTRQQILDLLAIANIDPDGYNIILQGDIVRLVEMSPNERRQIIEDIAGISVYEDKKNKALSELGKVEEKLNEAEIILSERKTYLKELKKDRDEALKYKDLSDKMKRAKATYNDMQVKKRTKKEQELEKSIKKNEEDVTSLEKKIEELKISVKDKREQVAKLSKEIEEKGEKEQVRIMKDIENLKVDIATNKTRISSDENEITRITQRKDQLQGSVSDLDEKLTDLNKTKAEHEKERSSLEKQISQLKARIRQLKEKHKLDESDSVENDMDNLDKEAEERQKELQELREKQQEVFREKDKIELYISTVDEKIRKVTEVAKEHKADIEKLRQKRQEFKKATLELNNLINDDSKMAAELANARERLSKANDELAKLRSKQVGIQQKLMDSIALRSILDSKGKFGKVHGVVSDLGSVASRYALALETAAGPRIKSLVVDTDKTASNCIKHLKQRKLGTATFLPLNKIKGSDKPFDKAVLKAGGVHGRAADLVDYRPELKNAFEYVFGNTLVVDNIDVARRIGVGSVRMVTLDGDLVEMSGAMHGGFRQKKRGLGFQEKELSSEIEEKEKVSADMQRLVDRLSKNRSENEERIARLRELKANLEGDIIKGEKGLHLEEGDLEANRKEKKDYAAKLKEIDKKISSYATEINKKVRELTDIKVKRQNLRSKINEMRNPTVLAELNTFEQKQSELREKLIQAESDIKNADMQKQNILDPEKQKTQKILSQLDKEEAKFTEEIKDLKARIKSQQKELTEKEKKQKQFYGKYKELFTKKDKLSDTAQKEENRIIRHEEEIRRIQQKNNNLSMEMARIKAELAGLEEERKKYSDVQLLRAKTEEELKKEVWEMEKMMEKAGNINMRALEVYDSIEREYNALTEKREKLMSEKDQVLVMINEIETKKKDAFMKTFEEIEQHFRQIFSKLTTKGEAFLELENKEDPLAEGMRIKVRIVGKKFLDIRSLSGGEKTLTALAFIFAIQEHEPASLYILDEVDAALDKRNSEKLAEMIESYSKNAQYIIISHNDNVISRADTLYGVSMNEHSVSKVVSLKL